MFTDPTLTLADQLLGTIDWFCKAMAAEACKRRIGLFSVAIWARVRRFERRFGKLYAQWKAGTLPTPRERAAAELTPHPTPPPQGGREPRVAGPDAGVFDAGACDAASCERARLRPASVLPRAFAWLRTLVPMSAGPLAGDIESLLLNYPETREFVAAAPQAGRILRPFCKMVGVKPPEWLALPKRKRTSPRPSPHSGEGEVEAELRRLTARFPDTPAARAAKRALARSLAGLPVNVSRLSAVAYGYFVHPPRDGNCPPPEIGYAPSRLLRRVPKDYAGFSKKWD